MFGWEGRYCLKSGRPIICGGVLGGTAGSSGDFQVKMSVL
jgi:hypothetical protein